MSSNYETLYGVHLLDDLHNYFPALLYDSSEFGSVQDVLAYIQSQTRNRFDLFSYGLREYLSTHPQPAPVEPNSYRRVVRTSYASVPASMPVPLSTLLRHPPAPLQGSGASSAPLQNATTVNVPQTNVPSIQVELNTLMHHADDEEEEEETLPINDALSRTLLSLLQIPNTGITRSYDIDSFAAILNGRQRNMDQFLQPVVVRPTVDQIAANTTLGNLVSDTEHACAICQDTLQSEQEGRKLNACGHWFHKNCIDTWLSGNVHCPVCRHDIREPLRSNSPSEDTT